MRSNEGRTELNCQIGQGIRRLGEDNYCPNCCLSVDRHCSSLFWKGKAIATELLLSRSYMTKFTFYLTLAEALSRCSRLSMPHPNVHRLSWSDFYQHHLQIHGIYGLVGPSIFPNWFLLPLLCRGSSSYRGRFLLQLVLWSLFTARQKVGFRRE